MNETASNSGRRANSSLQERQQWVEQLRRSGLTQAAFARQNGLKLTTLQSWIYQRPVKPPKSQAPAGWCEVPRTAWPAPGVWAAEVALPNGITVRLAAQGTQSLLAQILSRVPCLR